MFFNVLRLDIFMPNLLDRQRTLLVTKDGQNLYVEHNVKISENHLTVEHMLKCAFDWLLLVGSTVWLAVACWISRLIGCCLSDQSSDWLLLLLTLQGLLSWPRQGRQRSKTKERDLSMNSVFPNLKIYFKRFFLISMLIPHSICSLYGDFPKLHSVRRLPETI
jgi:hypothetical protein